MIWPLPRIGQVGDLAGAGCGDSGFNGRVRLFARSDAFEEILHVRDGAVAEAVFLEDGILVTLDALAIDGESAAIDFQGCLGPAEFEAAVVDGGAIMPS